MKTGNFFIYEKMEEILENKLKKIGLHNYMVIIEEPENGANEFVYDFIEFKTEEKTYSVHENKDEFYELIKKLETKRTIKTMYERCRHAVDKELMEEELELPVTAGVNDYIIWIAVVMVIVIFLIKLFE